MSPTYYVWTCPDCGFTFLRDAAPAKGEHHAAVVVGGNCKTPYSYVEIGTVVVGPGGQHYMKLPPMERRRRLNA